MRDDGFTLIETLVAMALVAMLALGLSQAIGIVGKAWRGISAQSDPAVVAAFLRRQIGAAQPLHPDDYGLSGGADRLEFIGAAPAAWLPAGLYRHRIELRKDELWYVWGPLGGGASERRLLADARLEMAYAAKQGRWQPSWADPAHLPRMVRLRLVVGGEAWPELLANPMVDWPVLDRP